MRSMTFSEGGESYIGAPGGKLKKLKTSRGLEMQVAHHPEMTQGEIVRAFIAAVQPLVTELALVAGGFLQREIDALSG